MPLCPNRSGICIGWRWRGGPQLEQDCAAVAVEEVVVVEVEVEVEEEEEVEVEEEEEVEVEEAAAAAAIAIAACAGSTVSSQKSTTPSAAFAAKRHSCGDLTTTDAMPAWFTSMGMVGMSAVNSLIP